MWWARRDHGWQDSSSYTCEVDFLGEVLEIHILVTEASEELLDVFLLFGHEFLLSQFISVVLSLAAEVASHLGAEQGNAFLFTGDAEYESETDVLDAGENVRCDVIKAGHHGSRTSTGYRLLYEAQPKYAVISCGADNEYGHPHDDTLSRLRDADVTVYRTDLNGTIVCRSDGVNLTFTTEKEG